MTQPPCQGCLCTGQASTSLESRISANLEAVQKGMDSADTGSVGRRINMNSPHAMRVRTGRVQRQLRMELNVPAVREDVAPDD